MMLVMSPEGELLVYSGHTKVKLQILNSEKNSTRIVFALGDPPLP